MRNLIIPSYLYQQYSDDSDLQAFVAAYNLLAQRYLNTFNQLNLPVYTNPLITGQLLDWVGQGIYGFSRPSLAAPTAFSGLGVYDTIPYDTNPYSYDIKSGAGQQYTVTDDYYKRILTWNFYKGDGFQYNTTWLKNRVARFLFGLNGAPLEIDQTYNLGTPAVLSGCTVSGTTLTVGSVVSGTIIPYMILSGAGITEPTFIVSGSGNTWTLSQSMTISTPEAMQGLNAVSVTYTAPNSITIKVPNLPIAPIFQSAIQEGVLYVPFQYNYTVTY
jgi:hypothetical protein